MINFLIIFHLENQIIGGSSSINSPHCCSRTSSGRGGRWWGSQVSWPLLPNYACTPWGLPLPSLPSPAAASAPLPLPLSLTYPPPPYCLSPPLTTAYLLVLASAVQGTEHVVAPALAWSCSSGCRPRARAGVRATAVACPPLPCSWV